jgi:hypothetical protein
LFSGSAGFTDGYAGNAEWLLALLSAYAGYTFKKFWQAMLTIYAGSSGWLAENAV